jgi:hypothetical protein
VRAFARPVGFAHPTRYAGLYAAGETTGHFYRSAPNGVSVLRALGFGSKAKG